MSWWLERLGAVAALPCTNSQVALDLSLACVQIVAAVLFAAKVVDALRSAGDECCWLPLFAGAAALHAGRASDL